MINFFIIISSKVKWMVNCTMVTSDNDSTKSLLAINHKQILCQIHFSVTGQSQGNPCNIALKTHSALK